MAISLAHSCRSRIKLYLGVLPEAGEEDVDMSIGLIVLENLQAEITWQRIGICVWSELMDDSNEDESIWQPFIGRLG